MGTFWYHFGTLWGTLAPLSPHWTLSGPPLDTTVAPLAFLPRFGSQGVPSQPVNPQPVLASRSRGNLTTFDLLHPGCLRKLQARSKRAFRDPHRPAPPRDRRNLTTFDCIAPRVPSINFKHAHSVLSVIRRALRKLARATLACRVAF